MGSEPRHRGSHRRRSPVCFVSVGSVRPTSRWRLRARCGASRRCRSSARSSPPPRRPRRSRLRSPSAPPALLDAQGAALGLLETDDVLVVDPIGIAARFHVPGRRVSSERQRCSPRRCGKDESYARTTGTPSSAEFPESAAMLPSIVQSAVAIPLWVAGKPLGVVEFLFDRPDAIDDELAALAPTAASLAEQALERARLYERERETRAALDRILQVAPRFHAETADEVTEVICREARMTFGADYGVLWRIRDDMLELLRSDPRRDEWPTGLRVPLADFPGLEGAVSSLAVSFVADVLVEARGEGLDRVRQLGIRSSLRSPIVIGGRYGARARRVVADGDRSARSRDDRDRPALRRPGGAGLRAARAASGRGAGRLAGRRDPAAAGDHRRALTGGNPRRRRRDLPGARSAARRRRGRLRRPHGLGGNLGADDLGPWATPQKRSRRGALSASTPMCRFARAIASGEPVWALTREEMDVFTDAPALGDAGWISIPLRTPAGVHGALHVSLHEPRELGDGERRWLQSVVSQCALALERSQLYDEEQRLRELSERLQRTTAALSNALTQSDVGGRRHRRRARGHGGRIGRALRGRRRAAGPAPACGAGPRRCGRVSGVLAR